MSKQYPNSKNEQGYILLAVMLLMTLMLIALSLELPRISQQIRRGKEEELVHRGEQYKMAIKRFLRKNGRYPASLEQLDNTNQIRYLRKHYKDPITGKDEWRILHVGEVQLNAGNGQLQTAGGGGNNLFGAPGSMGTNSGFGNSGGTGTMGTPGITGSSGSTGTTGSTGSNTPGPTVGPSTTSGPGSGSFGTGNVQFGGAGIIGVTSTSKEKSIKERNGKDHYNEWLFVYDPRLDATTQPGAPGAGGVGTPTGGQGGPGAGGIGGPGPGGTGGPGGINGPGPGPGGGRTNQ